mmetsp:Transcript_16852/g.50333  ORF Transcript_16852/g.50333 Transcript_16852/m.50333 type:complete len:351 (+) Transcript_16852:225-1277(+)
MKLWLFWPLWTCGAFRARAETFRARWVPSSTRAPVEAPAAGPRVFFTCVAAAGDDLLPWLLEYYAAMGIPGQRFVLALHAPRTDANYTSAAALVEAAGAPGHVAWTSRYSGAAKEAVRRYAFAVFRGRGVLRNGDWIVHADSDEFIEFRGGLGAALRRARERKATHVLGAWTDRVAETGELRPAPGFAPGSGALFEAYPLSCAFRRKPKVVAYAFPHGVTDGAHAPLEHDARTLPGAADVLHFKWRAGVLARLRARVAVKLRPRCAWCRGKAGAAALVAGILAHLEAHGGVCVGCHELRGVCCRGCDPDSLRNFPDFLRPARPAKGRGRWLLCFGAVFVGAWLWRRARPG